MTEVIVYVEGPSDQLSMQELFADVMEIATQQGKRIGFFPMNGKEPLLNQGPIKAINILRNKPDSHVFLVPDLYPMNKPFAHTTFAELKESLLHTFKKEMRRKGCDDRMITRFFVHCFKYDLEALILASETPLLTRLEKNACTQSWVMPIENQNHHKPPKRIVESLFRDAGKKYKDTVDAPWIFKRSRYQDLIEKCPQCFKPFVEDVFKALRMERS